MDEAIEYNGVGKNELQEGQLDPRSKLDEKQSTIGTHKAMV